jgi:hypothetical protein
LFISLGGSVQEEEESQEVTFWKEIEKEDNGKNEEKEKINKVMQRKSIYNHLNLMSKSFSQQPIVNFFAFSFSLSIF